MVSEKKGDLMPKELKTYIKKELDKGFTVKKITNRLLESGYSKESINKVVKSLGTKQKRFRNKSIVLIVFIITIIVISFVFDK